jgi:RNA polymerase sigma-70 factor (ECF subfamily)
MKTGRENHSFCRRTLTESRLASDSSKADRFWKHLNPLQGALEAYCRRSVFDAGMAEDVLQEAVMLAYRDFDLFTEGSSFRAWIFRYLNLTVLAANRKSTSRPETPFKEEPTTADEWILEFDAAGFGAFLHSPELVLEQCDETLTGAIRRLNELERSALLLKAVAGFGYREIAEVLGHPMGTVMSALSRARQRLRFELVEYAREQGLLRLDEKNNDA